MNTIQKTPAVTLRPQALPSSHNPDPKKLASLFQATIKQRDPLSRFCDKWFGVLTTAGGILLIGWAVLYNAVIKKPGDVASPETPITGQEVPTSDTEEPLILEEIPLEVEPLPPKEEPKPENNKPPKINEPVEDSEPAYAQA